MHMDKSPALKWAGVIAWAITALAAIAVGLKPLGYDLHDYLGAHQPMLVAPIQYIIGVCGVISLILLVTHASMCGAHHDRR